MIIFSKRNADGMDAFKIAIREQIVEMASHAISPIWGEWERFDKEIAHKLHSGEIEYDEASKKFAEDFYKQDLNGLTIDGEAVIFHDSFNTEDTCCEGGYELNTMVAKLRESYPDIEVFGCGWIDYHYGATSYILIANSDTIVFKKDISEQWQKAMWFLSTGITYDEDLFEEFSEIFSEDFSIEKMRADIERFLSKFLSKYNLKYSVTELIDKFGCGKAKKLFE